jgi:hypothetical protein
MSMVNQLFDYKRNYNNLYYDITLKVNIGSLKIGDKFEMSFINYDQAVIEFRRNTEIFVFDLVLTMKETK